MRRAWHTMILVACLAGCSGYVPMRVETDNKVVLEGPLRGSFTAELPAAKDAEPLGEVVLECCGGELTKADKTALAGGPKVALIDVDGLLLNTNYTGLYSNGENPVALFKEKLDRCAADGQVRAVVLRVNSQGGSVAATDLMARELQSFRARSGKPVVVCVLDLGCGGAYFLATLGDQIIAQPSSLVGGVGVILNLYNLRELMAQFNVLGQSIKAGDNIDMGTAAAAISPEARQLLQTMADEYHEMFKEVVKSRRKLGPQAEYALDGRVVTARQAQELGLIDSIGYLEDAVALARGLGRAPGACVVMLRRPGEAARTPYAVSANAPVQLLPLSVPGIDRTKLPTFMYAWTPEPTAERVK
jgi:protease-4